MQDLVGEEMLLHPALTAFVSSERNWLQDDCRSASWPAMGTFRSGGDLMHRGARPDMVVRVGDGTGGRYVGSTAS